MNATNEVYTHQAMNVVCSRRLLHACDYHAVMIRFKLHERLSDMSFARGRRVTLDEVASLTGIHRTTLSRLNKPTGANVTTDNLDRLCRFFGCKLSDLAEYVETELPEPGGKPGQIDRGSGS